MTTFKFYLLSSLGAITLKEIYSNWKMFSREGLGSELKDTRKRWSKKTKLAFYYYTTQSAKKPCKLAGAILSRKERLPKSEMNAALQKHSSVGVLWKQCSWKFRKIHRKTPVPESLFNKVVGLKPATLLKKSLWHRCFSVNFAKFLRTASLQSTSGGCFWESCQTSIRVVFAKIVKAITFQQMFGNFLNRPLKFEKYIMEVYFYIY